MKLYEYQQEYLKDMPDSFVIAAETGTGKTIMGIEQYKRFHSGEPLLIVAPAAKVKEGDWQRTIELMTPDTDYNIISYNKLAKVWREYEGRYVIFDECHKLKNSTGVWGKAAFNLTKRSAGHLLLSASPVPNDYIDMANYLKIFGLTRNKTQFLKKYAIQQNLYGYNEIVGWKYTDELEEQWASISKRLRKEDALDLPPITFKDFHFKASPRYKTLKKTKMLDGEPYDTQMLLRHGLRMNTAMDDKVAYLKEYLESTEENVLVFYNYDAELEAIKAVVDKKTYECNGHTKEYPKKQDWVNTENTVTLANYSSGSEAVEFTYCSVIIYFSPTDSYTAWYQSYGRAHRNGQLRKVTAHKYITQNTIEVDIYRALSAKKDFNYKLWEGQEL